MANLCWYILLHHFLTVAAVAIASDDSAAVEKSVDHSDRLKGGLWLSLRLTSSSFDTSCFSGGCSQPRLRIIVSDVQDEQRKTASWKIDDKRKQLVTTATDDNHADDFVLFSPKHDSQLRFKLEVVGRDSTYNFPRICDASQPLQPFLLDFSSSTTLTAEANCFNATTILTLYCCEVYCYHHPFLTPWCNLDKEQRDVALAKSFSIVDSSGTIKMVPFWVAALLSFIILGLTIIVMTTLIIQLRRHRKYKGSTFWKHRAASSRHGNTNGNATGQRPTVAMHSAGLYRSASQESKYDQPWDQKFRPLPHWLRTEIRGVGLAAVDNDSATINGHRHHTPPSPPPTDDSCSPYQHRTVTDTASSCLEAV